MAQNAAAGGSNQWRTWEGLNCQVLALIFTKIPADEVARTLPFVCRSWREAVAGPYCWSEIDIVKWSRRVNHTDAIDFAVRKLVLRSRHSLRRLSANHIGNSGFSDTAYFGNNLKVLQIPFSEVNDFAIEKFSGSLKVLAILDISYCKSITSMGIKILGKNCTSLVHLQRNMGFHVSKKINDDEALAVANAMTRLEKLELANGHFSDHGLGAILRNCKALSSLNIRGCRNVKLAGNVGKSCYALKFFKDHNDDEYKSYALGNIEHHDFDDD